MREKIIDATVEEFKQNGLKWRNIRSHTDI